MVFEGAATIGGPAKAVGRLTTLAFAPDLLDLAERIARGEDAFADIRAIVRGLNFLVAGYCDAADGLIVSTPTGSTAYSFSARGPVVSPKHRALLVTPVAPHMLFDRSLVLDPSETVEIQVGGDRQAAVVIDGHNRCQLSTGAIVRCEPSASTADFVRFRGRHYHQVLKAKFGLTDR